MSDPLLPQKTYSFKAVEIEKVPEEGGVFVILTIRNPRHLVIDEASDLRQALLDALPPLGPTVRLSQRLDQIEDNLYFAFRIVSDAKEREDLALLLISRFQPESNNW